MQNWYGATAGRADFSCTRDELVQILLDAQI
jgi:hypothetical protein